MDNPALRQKAIIGGVATVELQHRVLYAIRAHKYNALMSLPEPLRRYTKVIDVVRYPSGEIALYLGEIGPSDSARPIHFPD